MCNRRTAWFRYSAAGSALQHTENHRIQSFARWTTRSAPRPRRATQHPAVGVPTAGRASMPAVASPDLEPVARAWQFPLLLSVDHAGRLRCFDSREAVSVCTLLDP